LTLAAHWAHDSVGLIFFSDEVECTIEPAYTKQQINFLLQKIYNYRAEKKSQTNMNQLFRSIAHEWSKDAIVFVLSDFIVDDIEQSLRAVSASVDLVALRCYDPVERTLPGAGFVIVEDVEHDTRVLIETNDGSSASQILRQRLENQNVLFARAGIDVLDLSYADDICARLVEFFKRRMVHAAIRYG